MRRYASRKRCDAVFYNMAVVLASVATGFDIRISNTSAIHPRLHSSSDSAEPVKRREKDGYIGHRRDAYLAAVRDSFIEPETHIPDYSEYSSASGYAHNTYHGQQTRHRPSVNFDDIPLQFPEVTDSDGRGTSPSVTSSTVSRKTSVSSSVENENLTLISLPSPAHDRQHVYQRQTSDTSSAFETPRTTPKTTPLRQFVKFEDSIKHGEVVHRRSPSNTSNSSNPSYENSHRPESYDFDSYRLPPGARLSYRRTNSHEPPERPRELDISAQQKQQQQQGRHGILKNPSPGGGQYPSMASYAAESTAATGSEDGGYLSARSGLSPGNTPPHIGHHKTLLDIDMEGQKEDSTVPIAAMRHLSRKPTVSELEKEFL